MKKLVLLLLLISLFCALFCVGAHARETSEQLIDGSRVADSYEVLDEQSRALLKEWGLESIDADAVVHLGFKEILRALLSVFQLSAKDIIGHFALLLCAVILSALTGALGNGFAAQKHDKIFSVCAAAVCISVVMKPFLNDLQGFCAAVECAGALTVIILPALCALMAAKGQAVGAAIFGAAVPAASQVISTLFLQFFMPVSTMLLAFGIASGFSEMAAGEKIAQALRKYITILLSLCASVYFGLLGLKSNIGAAADGAALKAVKAASSLVPVIGSAVGESAAAVVSSIALTKSVIGVFGILCLFAVFMPVIVKSTLWYLCLELSALAAESFGCSEVKRMLSSMAATVSIIGIILVFCALFFILNFALVCSLRGGA